MMANQEARRAQTFPKGLSGLRTSISSLKTLLRQRTVTKIQLTIGNSVADDPSRRTGNSLRRLRSSHTALGLTINDYHLSIPPRVSINPHILTLRIRVIHVCLLFRFEILTPLSPCVIVGSGSRAQLLALLESCCPLEIEGGSTICSRIRLPGPVEYVEAASRERVEDTESRPIPPQRRS